MPGDGSVTRSTRPRSPASRRTIEASPYVRSVPDGPAAADLDRPLLLRETLGFLGRRPAEGVRYEAAGALASSS
jgi:hypothetical protein